jgi:hypothetical protein
LRPWERAQPPTFVSTARGTFFSSSLAPVIEINVRHIGRKPQPQALIGATAPEGWIKKIDRPRAGKVWVGYFHLYVADSFRSRFPPGQFAAPKATAAVRKGND